MSDYLDIVKAVNDISGRMIEQSIDYGTGLYEISENEHLKAHDDDDFATCELKDRVRGILYKLGDALQVQGHDLSANTVEARQWE